MRTSKAEKEALSKPVPTDSNSAASSWLTLSGIFGWNKSAYHHVASEFHPFHRHDVNVLFHLFTTGLGVWGTLQLAVANDWMIAVYIYAATIALTTPLLWTAVLHTVYVAACLQLPVAAVGTQLSQATGHDFSDAVVCLVAIVAGYGLQDLAHYLCQEPTYMGSYIGAKPWMLIVHSVWLMPLVIDAVLMRHCFVPMLLVTRNRNVVVDVASRQSVEDLRTWINQNVPSTPETTHVWPHDRKETSVATVALEQDAAILAGFRRVFAAKHFDVKPVQGMNEIYVTAVGAKKEINSDAVFYTSHCDGPYWFTPCASLYRVLVGLTPNQMVRTRFNLQHESQDQVLDMYGVVGFDYNRELHYIDHVPGVTNTERRSVLKLHFVVYPKGWHAYGNLVESLNTMYNTWARGNFLKTLRPRGMYEYVMAWWIWLTTFANAVWEEYFGWANLVYIGAAYVMGPLPFLILTSFRNYPVYMATFAYRQPPVAHGYLIRDSKLYKAIAMMHLGHRLLPLVLLPQDLPGVVLTTVGFATAMAATARLGMVRTYFGLELGFVKPAWVNAFPYGIIPHPMMMGQLFANSAILAWFWSRLSTETVYLIAAHMVFYFAHMIQEILTSSY